MTNPADVGRRLVALETRNGYIVDLGVRIDANRAAINALGVQTAGRFEQVDRRFDQVDRRIDGLENEMRTGFAEMRAKLDQPAAGQQRIVDLLTGMIDDRP